MGSPLLIEEAPIALNPELQIALSLECDPDRGQIGVQRVPGAQPPYLANVAMPGRPWPAQAGPGRPRPAWWRTQAAAKVRAGLAPASVAAMPGRFPCSNYPLRQPSGRSEEIAGGIIRQCAIESRLRSDGSWEVPHVTFDRTPSLKRRVCTERWMRANAHNPTRNSVRAPPGLHCGILGASHCARPAVVQATLEHRHGRRALRLQTDRRPPAGEELATSRGSPHKHARS
jgi:hypothetical protein